LTGSSTFNDNHDGGLWVLSLGAISANNLTASHNLSFGVALDNSGGTAGVTLTGTNSFTENSGTGLSIGSLGVVVLSKVTADANADGVFIVGAPSSITLTCGSFTANGGYGVYAFSTGLVKLIGVVASGNGITDIFSTLPLVMVPGCPLP